MIERIVHNRWFALGDIALVLLCAMIWYLWPEAGGWLLPLLLLPWILRSIAGRSPVRRSFFELPIILFALTAAWGVWSAYDRGAAWAKFWILVAGIFLFYAIARQPRVNFWVLAGLFSALGALLSLYFLLTHDWHLLPADLEFLNRIGIRWMEIRPSLPFPGMHPNFAGGLIAMFFPFNIALSMRARRKKNRQTAGYAILASLISLLGLVFTSSRAAWAALAIALVIWTAWGISRVLTNVVHMQRRGVFALLMLPMVLLLFGSFILAPNILVNLLGSLPGLDSSVSRVEIARNTLELVADYPYTGGGLQAFPGLYSQYIMRIPVYLFFYSHNLYLDIALEQGIFGLAAFLLVLVGCFWMLVVVRPSETLRWATISSLVVMLLHGFADDPLYGEFGTPFLFVLPGIAAAIYHYATRSNNEDQHLSFRLRIDLLQLGGFCLLSFGMLFYVTGGSFISAWDADLGAVYMARYVLAESPTAGWQDPLDLEELEPSIESFKRSLQRDPNDVTANYRLGRIAMTEREFTTARIFLEKALKADPDHRGIWKALGYCYAWLGMQQESVRLLSTVPEARSELEVYIWWWEMKHREDLGRYAADTLELLEASTAQPGLYKPSDQ